MRQAWILVVFGVIALPKLCAAYELLREYAGPTFFDGWDFYGSWDNLTLGDVWWLDEQDAASQNLAYVNGANNAVIRVDNSSNVPLNEKRNTVRITTQDSYTFGSLWIIDLVHIPFGCSVWPAFWSKGQTWPDDGEIDIIEGVNLMSKNQMALHTTPGCFHTTPPDQVGQSGGLGPGNIGGSGLNGNGQNATDCSTGAGCTVSETKASSFGSAFRDGGGGVWATQFDIAGIYIWYWPRSAIPASIQQATSTSGIDLSDWGAPSASYPNTTCTMESFFTPQQLVLDITLCGDWAGVGAVYNGTCGNSGPTGLCYNDNVVGPGSPRYDDAYFEVKYLRTYTTVAPSTTPTPALDSTATPSPVSSGGANALHSSASQCELALWALVAVTLSGLFGGLAVF